MDQLRSAIILAAGYETAEASVFISSSGEVVSKAELCGRFNKILSEVDPHTKADFTELLYRYTSMATFGYVGLRSIFKPNTSPKFGNDFDEFVASVHKYNQRKTDDFNYLTEAAIVGLASLVLLRKRKLLQNTVKKLEKIDSDDLQAAIFKNTLPPFAEEICNNLQLTSSERRAALMKSAKENGVKLLYRHFFEPNGSLRDEKDVCKMLIAVPPPPLIEKRRSRGGNRYLKGRRSFSKRSR